MQYRIEMSASICFDVSADNEDAAVAEAKRLARDEWCDGLDVSACDDREMRLYPDYEYEGFTPEISVNEEWEEPKWEEHGQ